MPVSRDHGARFDGLRPAPQVVYRTVDDEAILLEPTTGRYFSLDEVGSRAWALLIEHGALKPVADALHAEYDVDLERLTADLEELVERLLERGLLKYVEDG